MLSCTGRHLVSGSLVDHTLSATPPPEISTEISNYIRADHWRHFCFLDFNGPAFFHHPISRLSRTNFLQVHCLAVNERERISSILGVMPVRSCRYWKWGRSQSAVARSDVPVILIAGLVRRFSGYSRRQGPCARYQLVITSPSHDTRPTGPRICTRFSVH